MPRIRTALLTLLTGVLLAGSSAPGQALASHGQPTFFEGGSDLLEASTRPHALEQLQALGVHALRVELYWGTVAPAPTSATKPSFDASNPASYNWGQYDALLAEAKRLHWPVLLTVTSPAPRWATSNHSAPYVTRPDQLDFQEFMTAVGRHYGSDEFDVTDVGPMDGRVVIALHGFPDDRLSWSGLGAELAAVGRRVLAFDQRGYSPGARPAGRAAYKMGELVDDVLALADAAGAAEIDVIGHDWGAVVGWNLAARHPERVRTLCALSVPHPRAFRRAFVSSPQLLHSWYIGFFQLPWLPERLLSAGAGRFVARGLERNGLDHEAARRYQERASTPGAMTGPVNWYRAVRPGDLPGPVSVPTLFVWGARDRYVTRQASAHCGDWVTAPYRYVPLASHGHWLPTGALDEIAPLIVAHLDSV